MKPVFSIGFILVLCAREASLKYPDCDLTNSNLIQKKRSLVAIANRKNRLVLERNCHLTPMTKQYVTKTYAIDTELHTKITEVAKSEGKSISFWIRKQLSEAIDKKPPQQ